MNLIRNPVEIVQREYPFSFEIQDIIINGKIDRIDKGEDGYSVIDYKTSKNTTKAEKSVQLAIYSMFLQQEKQLDFRGIPESAHSIFYAKRMNR